MRLADRESEPEPARHAGGAKEHQHIAFHENQCQIADTRREGGGEHEPDERHTVEQAFRAKPEQEEHDGIAGEEQADHDWDMPDFGVADDEGLHRVIGQGEHQADDGDRQDSGQEELEAGFPDFFRGMLDDRWIAAVLDEAGQQSHDDDKEDVEGK